MQVWTWLVLVVAASVLPLALFSGRLLIRGAAEETRQTEQLVRDRALLVAEDVDRGLSRIFGAAERLASIGSTVVLSTPRSIVEAHGGRIRADANPGGGAVFLVTMPMAEAPAHA
ncbi:hypothetical protein TSO221_13560 [Azospirillum sp. TSO22-1]|nr:hypothetical protein TSO221_13560 [Azospirillum sp. TSO22-1]